MPRLPDDAVGRIVAIFEAAGATAKVSSIHVNGWFGAYDKLSTAKIMMSECFGIDLDADKNACVFVGDSPNDVPMFRFFPNAVGVANIGRFMDQLAATPAYVTRAAAGAGFAEVADMLCRDRE